MPTQICTSYGKAHEAAEQAPCQEKSWWDYSSAVLLHDKLSLTYWLKTTTIVISVSVDQNSRSGLARWF